jgi:hypothetical protein
MKYLLLTHSQYIKLNHDISVSEGYDLNSVNVTKRQYSVNPIFANTDEGVKLAMPFDDDMQTKYASLIQGLTLHDEFTPLAENETVPDEWIASGLISNQVDWQIRHCAAEQIYPAVLVLEDEPRTTASDEAVLKLIEKDSVIITVEP